MQRLATLCFGKASLIALGLVLIVGCQNVVKTVDTTPTVAESGAYILCEGLWRQDNATLSRFDAGSLQVSNDFFARVNAGLRIGDTANDMVLQGDTLFIAVSTSRSIEIIRASTGVWIGRIRLEGMRQEPRNITLVNDSTAFVSNLNDDSVTEFDTRTFAIRRERIAVGPAPEGIAATRKYVFVANSGYGDFRAQEPKAGTISVLDVATRTEVRTITGVPNVIALCTNPAKTRFYAFYKHLLSQRDSVGGIVEYDAESLQELRRWRMKSPSSPAFSMSGDTLFFLGENGVELLALKQQAPQPTLAVRKTETNALWYGLAVHPRTSELWICNARDYSVNGEVVVMRLGGEIVRRFDVGINPNTIVFF
jgi:DNA-binding beta-propeller fold protein YncE